jgi:short-subunit dehydrogenase
MVSLKEVQSSNARISSSFPSGLVAVFVGATRGIGEYTLKQFARYTVKPRVYFIGRSQGAADRIQAECKALNSEGEYSFIKADTSLIENVDNVCRDIRKKETAINLLVLSTGMLIGDESMFNAPQKLAHLHSTELC